MVASSAPPSQPEIYLGQPRQPRLRRRAVLDHARGDRVHPLAHRGGGGSQLLPQRLDRGTVLRIRSSSSRRRRQHGRSGAGAGRLCQLRGAVSSVERGERLAGAHRLAIRLEPRDPLAHRGEARLHRHAEITQRRQLLTAPPPPAAAVAAPPVAATLLPAAGAATASSELADPCEEEEEEEEPDDDAAADTDAEVGAGSGELAAGTGAAGEGAAAAAGVGARLPVAVAQRGAKSGMEVTGTQEASTP
eukprot:COSAG01_NODE_7616_length_3125_cov_4.038004_3_plen_247_part_00